MAPSEREDKLLFELWSFRNVGTALRQAREGICEGFGHRGSIRNAYELRFNPASGELWILFQHGSSDTYTHIHKVCMRGAQSRHLGGSGKAMHHDLRMKSKSRKGQRPVQGHPTD